MIRKTQQNIVCKYEANNVHIYEYTGCHVRKYFNLLFFLEAHELWWMLSCHEKCIAACNIREGKPTYMGSPERYCSAATFATNDYALTACFLSGDKFSDKFMFIIYENLILLGVPTQILIWKCKVVYAEHGRKELEYIIIAIINVDDKLKIKCWISEV